MADPELVRVLDYILNRCGEAEIEAVAAAVVRRKRDIARFGDFGRLDPARFAKQAADDLMGSMGANLESLRSTVRDMAERIVRREAPELSDHQVDELLGAWIGGQGEVSGRGDGDGRKRLPRDVALSMVDQFVSFSSGLMDADEEAGLRNELGEWPSKYWTAFPQVLKTLISDYLGGRIGDREFRRSLLAAVEL